MGNRERVESGPISLPELRDVSRLVRLSLPADERVFVGFDVPEGMEGTDFSDYEQFLREMYSPENPIEFGAIGEMFRENAVGVDGEGVLYADPKSLSDIYRDHIGAFHECSQEGGFYDLLSLIFRTKALAYVLGDQGVGVIPALTFHTEVTGIGLALGNSYADLVGRIIEPGEDWITPDVEGVQEAALASLVELHDKRKIYDDFMRENPGVLKIGI